MDSRPPPQADAAATEIEITKPRNDKREYRRVVLPNALELLLVSDPDTDKV
jgi:insulysin